MFSFRYPAVVLMVCTVAGTLLGRRLDPGLPVVYVFVVAAACFLLYGFLRLRREFFIIPLALMTIALALFNANKNYRSLPPDDIGRLVGCEEKIRFFGEIVKWPLLKRHKTLLVCRLDSVMIDQSVRRASGVILINLSRETTHFSLYDRISFSGKLREAQTGGYPGQFDYSRYLGSKGIRGTVWVSDPGYIMILKEHRNLFANGINVVRRWILECFQKNLSDRASALASGFLIGETRDIPDDVYLAFRRTGTMHLLAVSGSNVALVLVVVAFLLRFIRLGRVPRLMTLLIVILVFSHLSYNQPSVVRASIMAALILVARALYRRADLHNIIGAAATILIFFDPGNLYDIGFQLSFAVTWGLILFLPHINRLIVDRKVSRLLRYLLLIIFSSLIATLISAPITAYYFGEVSLVTVISNLLVVPLVSASVIGIVILLLVNLALPAPAILPGVFLDRLLVLIQDVVLWFGRWKFAVATTASFPAVYVFGFLIGVTILMLAVSHRLMRRMLILFLLSIGVYMSAVALFAEPDSPPDLEVYNMGTSQTVIVNQAPGIVIFRQNEDDRRDAFNSELLPYLTRRNFPMPRYFVFMEPHFKTENRLCFAAQLENNINFRPVQTESGAGCPTIWSTCQPSLEPDSGSGISFVGRPGAILIHLPDSGRLIFGIGLGSINGLPDNQLQKTDYCFVVIRNNEELVLIKARLDYHRAVIMPCRPKRYYPEIQSISRADGARPIIVGFEKNSIYLSRSHPDRD
jgi:ComEC/Rec2-related protein